ncbi:hypothetical protein NXF25_016281 [Crotalus adamanteus]|uniref:Uncharacterized protein n=1 Tax=Crotalus adamanteus TaxID=8729 RepID=A0AAW1AT62_CROAD
MGPLPAPTATSSLPRLRIGDKEEVGEKPSPLPLLDQMAIQCLDFRVKEQKEELAKTTEKSDTEPSSQKEEEATQPKATADPAGGMPPDSEEAPTVLKAMDEKMKMVEIQKGAFPEMVENSLRTFSIVSIKPLPKLIRFGNKLLRPKDLSLVFVAKEALCIIDFNISHKYMVFTWGIPKLHSRLTEKATPALSEATQCPSGPVKEIPQKPPAPILVLKTPRKRATTPRGAESKQILLIPKPQVPRIIPLAPAKRPQDVQFTDLFKQRSLAPSTPSKKAKGSPHWSLAVLLRDVPTQKHFEAEAPGEGIQSKKVALAMPSSESQGAVGKDSISIKQEALEEKTTEGKIRTLKAANLQEKLKDRPCSTDLPAPLKKGAKADGKDAGSEEDGDHQEEQEGPLHYTALPPTTKKGAENKKDGDERGELEGTMPCRAVPLSPEKGGSKRDEGRPAELEGRMRYTSTTETRAGTESKTNEDQQAELEGRVHYRPSSEKGASKKDGDEQGELEGIMCYRALPGTPKKGAATGSERDGGRPAELEGKMRYVSTAETGAGTGSKKDGDHQGELEGTLHYLALPLAPKKGARDGDRPAELEGMMRYSAIPKQAAQAEGEGTAAGRARSAQRFPARAAPSSPSPREAAAGESLAGAKSRGEADGKAAAGFKEARTSRKGRERAPRGDALALSLGVQAVGRQRDAPITRASLFLQLDLTKEKLNLHLQKRLEAALRPRQRAGLSLRVGTGAGKERGPPPHRPFCYVCMAPERRGAAVRTGCWALPQRILDMSDGRVPQVARLERRPREPRRGGPRRPARRRRRGAGQARPGEARAIKPWSWPPGFQRAPPGEIASRPATSDEQRRSNAGTHAYEDAPFRAFAQRGTAMPALPLLRSPLRGGASRAGKTCARQSRERRQPRWELSAPFNAGAVAKWAVWERLGTFHVQADTELSSLHGRAFQRGGDLFLVQRSFGKDEDPGAFRSAHACQGGTRCPLLRVLWPHRAARLAAAHASFSRAKHPTLPDIGRSVDIPRGKVDGRPPVYTPRLRPYAAEEHAFLAKQLVLKGLSAPRTRSAVRARRRSSVKRRRAPDRCPDRVCCRARRRLLLWPGVARAGEGPSGRSRWAEGEESPGRARRAPALLGRGGGALQRGFAALGRLRPLPGWEFWELPTRLQRYCSGRFTEFSSQVWRERGPRREELVGSQLGRTGTDTPPGWGSQKGRALGGSEVGPTGSSRGSGLPAGGRRFCLWWIWEYCRRNSL